MILQPDDVPSSNEDEKRAILTIQPRIPAGSLAFPEIPAGMIDDSGTFAGAAAKEIEEDTLSVFDCLDMFKIDMCEKIGSSHFEETQLLAADLRD